MNDNFRIAELKGTSRDVATIKPLLIHFCMVAIHTYHPVMGDSSGIQKWISHSVPAQEAYNV